MAVDTLGHLLTLCVTAANEQDRAPVKEFTARVLNVMEENVEVAFVDQGYIAFAKGETTFGRRCRTIT